MNSWEELRKQARHHENIINQKLVTLSKLSSEVIPVRNDNFQYSTLSEETFKSAVNDLKQIFSTLDTINNKLADILVEQNNQIMAHTSQRHREVFKDFDQEFKKIQQHFRERHEREDLLQSVRRVIDAYKTTSTVYQAPEIYAKEHNHLRNCNDLVDNQLEIAMEMKENLNSQTSHLKQIKSRLHAILNSSPLINGLLQKVKLRKRRDSLVMGLVLSCCALLMMAYTIS
ncbi:Golgi SNAP receptor complex member 1-like [Nilaparvata lugens]|uniref:Golgi SNAP receptor complex member 1-like n=1 Tax=Nilaparvata lugens TaxID=108931 RepID=UPI00193C9B9A|nr:Golgi SNAP receptor complex member 1-like [Nilaparvata lugens]